MYYYLSFFGGQNCKTGISAGAVSVHLSTGFSGMCLWKKVFGEADYPKTDFAVRKRDRGESTFEKCEIKSI